MKVINANLLDKFYKKISNIFAKKSETAGCNIANNLTTTVSGSALDATQGKILNDSITSLKKSVSDGKSAIASAITTKGVSTSSDASFSTMSSNIRSIKTPVFDISNITTFEFRNYMNDYYQQRRIIKNPYDGRNYYKDTYYAYKEYAPSSIFSWGMGLYLIIPQEWSVSGSNLRYSSCYNAMFILVYSTASPFSYSIIKSIGMEYGDTTDYFYFVAPYFSIFYCGR